MYRLSLRVTRVTRSDNRYTRRMKNSISISVNHKSLDITLEEPLAYVGNPAFAVKEFRAAVDRAADEIEKMLVAKYGKQITEVAS